MHHVKPSIVQPGRNCKGAQHRTQQGEQCIDNTVVLLRQQNVAGVGFVLGTGLNAGQSSVEGRPAAATAGNIHQDQVAAGRKACDMSQVRMPEEHEALRVTQAIARNTGPKKSCSQQAEWLQKHMAASIMRLHVALWHCA
jgi:hypothetical protein